MPSERVCCLWCPDWPVVAARARVPELLDAPVAIMGSNESLNGARDRGPVVQAASAEARREGVSRGLRRREAEARCAELTIIDSDDAADARAFETVVRAVETLVPQVVLDRPGRCSFSTRGPSRYFGGDEALAQRVLEVVRDTGVVDARVGIADGDLAAGLAARAADTLVVPRGESAAFLSPWSVGVLAPHVDGGPELADLLARLGLRTLGAFAELPEPSVLGRFGIPGVHAHRLARGESSSGSVPAALPPELVETFEFDPPAERVDEAAFAAKSLADRLLGRLDDLGLSCTRVIVEAETEHGERLARCWRHDGSLTPATLVTRVRWQLEGWLTATAGITMLRLVPDEVVPATGRQLGFWGGDPAAGDRAARALARVQGMLGPESVVTAVPVGGRTPTERVCWVPWGEDPTFRSGTGPGTEPASRSGTEPASRSGTEPASRSGTEPVAPWPGTVPGPSPARVFDPPRPADLVDADGQAITVSGRGEPSAAPAALRCAALPNGGGPLVAWAGPWPHDLRWWDRNRDRLRAGTENRLRARTEDRLRARTEDRLRARPEGGRGSRRRALWQVVVDGGGGTAIACLVAVTRGRAEVEAIYD